MHRELGHRLPVPALLRPRQQGGMRPRCARDAPEMRRVPRSVSSVTNQPVKLATSDPPRSSPQAGLLDLRGQLYRELVRRGVIKY